MTYGCQSGGQQQQQQLIGSDQLCSEAQLLREENSVCFLASEL
jgi:hypothetical protein